MELAPTPNPMIVALADLSGAPDGRPIRHVLEHTCAVSFTLDADGRIVRSEGPGRAALVRRRGDARGQLVSEAFADVPAVVEAVARALRGRAHAIRVTVSGLTFDCLYQPLWVGDRVVGVDGLAWPASDPPDAAALAAPGAGAPAGPVPGASAPDPAATLAAAGLTVRQAEVMCWLACGLRQAAIARRLFLSPSSVHTHTGALRDHFGVATTTALRRIGQARRWHTLADG